MAEYKKQDGQLALELNCTEHHVTGQSYSPTPRGEGGLFSCSVGPLPDETMAALTEAARAHTPVRLLFDEQTLLLEFITLERRPAQRVRIVGNVVPASRNNARA